MMRIGRSTLAGALAAAAIGLGCTRAEAVAPPVLVELFTSEGCSSCPPADALLTELARTRPDVLALDLHVDYWNGTGWRDPYSSNAFTLRQRAYAHALGQDEVYTPELVVDGTAGVVGSDRDAVHAAIAASRQAIATTLTLRRTASALLLDIAAGNGAGTVWLATYDDHHETRVGGGENGGRVLEESNVVRSLVPVAAWHGTALHLTLDPGPGQRQAAFVQAPDGRILAIGAASAGSA